MSFKEISYLGLWLPFCSAERNHLCNFGRGHYEERSCEFILNLCQRFRKMSFKIFLIWSSGGPPVQWSGSNYAILKQGIMGNIHVKLYEIWTGGSGGNVVSRKILRTTDCGRRLITITHIKPSAQVSEKVSRQKN